MLSPEQSQLVREKIASVLEVSSEAVVPSARLFADLGATPAHLKPLRLAIEAVLPVNIEPITDQVNARTAVDSQGRLTKDSLFQIAELLGDWPDRPKTPVTFFDLFTVGMVEAVAAKGLQEPSDESLPPLQLPPDQVERVHDAIAKACNIPRFEVHSELNLTTPKGQKEDEDEGGFRVAMAVMAAGRALNIDCTPDLNEFAKALQSYTEGTATVLTQRKLLRLVPNLESLPDDDQDQTSTVGLIERLCAAAIERRKSPPVLQDSQARNVSLGRYIAGWPAEDQKWWASLPAQMGDGRYRLFLAGMLRAAFMESGSLDGKIGEILEVAEEYAESGHDPGLLDKKLRAVKSWKLGRNPLWGGLLGILQPECSPEDGGNILMRVEHAFGWNQSQVIAAARSWQQSLMSPLKAPAEFEEKWCTEEVIQLARQMHDNRTFIDLPKLGTLLQAAGCSHPLVLDHCRDTLRRHLRGDWLVSAIITVMPPSPPPAPKTARGKAAPKPKKIRFPTMSSRTKRKYKEVIAGNRAGLPVATAWTAVWQSDHKTHQGDYKRDHPKLSADVLHVLGGMYPARLIVLPDAAIARRMELLSARELYLGLALWVRMSLIIWHTKPYRFEQVEGLHDGLAAGDELALQWALREFPFEPEMDTEVGSWTYLALGAIAARDEARFALLIDRWPHPPQASRAPHFESGLLAILRRDPTAVVNALDGILNEQRTSPDPQGFGAVSLTAHALHRAAYRLDPALVAGFDVQQTYPWDAEFHAVSTNASDPLQDFDFSNTPTILRDLLVTQQVPAWLRGMPKPERPGQEMVYLRITDVGTTPEAVRAVVSERWEWTPEEAEYRMAKLPQSLHMPRYLCDQLRPQLEAAGATAEVVP